MRLLISLSILFLSINSFTMEAPWQKYVGCYKTTSVSANGNSLKPGIARIENSFGAIKKYVSDPQNKQRIPAVNITIWGHESIIDPNILWPIQTSAFNDRGTYTSDLNGDHYQFDGIVVGTDWAYLPRGHEISINIKLNSGIDVKMLADQSLKVRFYYNAVKASNGEQYERAHMEATLKKVSCCDPARSLCRYP